MKTMKKLNEVKRVKETELSQYRQDGWQFCPKSEFKKSNQVKDVMVRTD